MSTILRAPHRLALVSVSLVSAASLAACHRKPVVAAPEPVASATSPAVDSTAIRDSIARARDAELARQRARDDSARRANEVASASAEQAAIRSALTAPVMFDFDRAELRDDARAALDAKVPLLTANPDVTIRIAGNTDERGSTEYNLALGQRRAATAKRYLTDRGIAANRIETISNGEEKPVAAGHDESAWSQNRRDEFEITGGAARLVRSR